MSAQVKFVDELPEVKAGGWRQRTTPTERLRAALAEQPGRWAEVQRFGPDRKDCANAARQRAAYLRAKGLDATSRKVGDEFLVFARVVSA
jgi:hypothetical protein